MTKSYPRNIGRQTIFSNIDQKYTLTIDGSNRLGLMFECTHDKSIHAKIACDVKIRRCCLELKKYIMCPPIIRHVTTCTEPETNWNC